MKFQKNVRLKNYTTFRIGGPAKYFCIAKTKQDLIKAVKWAKEKKSPFFILGGGSNLLVSDKGFNGLAIKLQTTNYKLSRFHRGSATKSGQTIKVQVDAGVSLAKLVSITANAGFSGMEWAVGIPGATVGGAVRGNAGAFETEMKDLVRKVTVLDAQDARTKTFNNKDCQFGYRKSIFKKNPNLIIFSVELELKKSGKDKIKEKIKEILGHRQGRHPKFPSAGSIFKNLKDVRARDLIEKAGLKGKKIGQAQISDQHANFIVNLGNATANDVLGLIALAKKKVKEKFGISLEEEIQYLDTK